VQGVAGMRHDARFETVGAAGERNVRATRAQRIGDGNRGIEMAARSSAGKQHSAAGITGH